MNKYKTLTMVTAAVAFALAGVAPVAAAGQSNRAEVALEVGTYSIDTARSEASITKLLSKNGFAQGSAGSGSIVIDGVTQASDALQVLDSLAAPSEVSHANLKTTSGTAVPFSVGQTVEYVKRFEVKTDEKGRKYVVPHLGETDSGLSVSLSPKVRKGGVVDLKVKSDLTRVQLKEYKIGGDRFNLLHRTSHSLASSAKLRADQAAVYVRYIPADKKTLFKAGEVLVTVVRAKAVK
jgi:hypothetical protein